MSSKWLLFTWILVSPVLAIDPAPAEGQKPHTIADCAAGVFDANNAAIQANVDAQLQRRGIAPESVPKVKDVRAICLEVPEASRTCEPAGASWWTKRLQTKLLYQVTEGAKFAGEFHVGVGGRLDVIGGFHEIVFVPASEMPRLLPMKLTNGKLYVGIPGTLEYSPYSAIQLQHLWDQGAMFRPFTSPRKRWRYLNPIGTFRTGVRKAMKTAAVIAQKKIAQLLERVESSPAEVVTEIESLVDAEKVEPRLLEKLRAADPTRLKRIMALMHRELDDEGTREDIIEAGLVSALFDSPARNYVVTMIGALNIGNFHDIGIKIRVGLLKYVKLSESAPWTVATLIGPLNIYTIDDVKVTIDFNRAHETAALENSLLSP